MANIGTKTWWSQGKSTWTLAYSMSRSGTTVSCTCTVTVSFANSPSATYYNDPIKATIYKDGTSKGTITVKGKTSGVIKGNTYSQSLTFTFNQTTGNVALKATLSDYDSSSVGTIEGTVAVPAAATVISSLTNCTTKSGMTINLTRYDNNFTNNVTISYDGASATAYNWNGGSFILNDNEVGQVYSKQGAGTSRTWTATVYTYSGNTLIGSNSKTFTMTTEALPTITSTSNFNVESSTNVQISFNGRGSYMYYGQVYNESNNTWVNCYTSGTKTASVNESVTPNATTIYSANSVSSSGAFRWYTTYTVGSYTGSSSYYNVNYYFDQSLCGPSFATDQNKSYFKYQVYDDASHDLLNASGSILFYDDTTDSNKIISTLNQLKFYVSGVANTSKNATVSSYYIEVPTLGRVDYDSISSNVATFTVNMLQSSGTVTAHVVDSRGFESTLQMLITLVDYFFPNVVSMSVERLPMSALVPSQETYLRLDAVVYLPNCVGQYLINLSHTTNKITYEYKVHSDSNWIEINTPLSKSAPSVGDPNGMVLDGNNLTLTFTNLGTNDSSTNFIANNQYDFRLKIYSYASTSSVRNDYSQVAIIPVSAPLVSRRPNMLGVNKVPTSATLDVGGSIHSDSYISSDANMQVGTFILFPTAFNPNTHQLESGPCTIQFRRSDTGTEYLRVQDDEVFLIKEAVVGGVTQTPVTYELIPFEEV